MTADGMPDRNARAGQPGAVPRVCVGRITGAHGVRGAFCVRSFTEQPDAVAAYGPLLVDASGRRLSLRIVGRKKGQVIVQADGIDDRTAAEALRGCTLSVERTALPPTDPDEYYYADLIGLAAFTAGADPAAGGTEVPLGRVSAVHDFGAGPVLELVGPDGAALLVPFTRAAVPDVDMREGCLRVADLPGLLAETVGDAVDYREVGGGRR